MTEISQEAVKTCRSCGKAKPLDAFHRDRAKSDGRGSYCKPCKARSNEQWRRANPERMAALNKQNARINPEGKAAAVRRYRKRYPEKDRARQILRDALKAGEITKPDRCEDCGRAVDHPLHGHHEDYSQPLAVAWLCSGCHGRRHRREAA